MKESQSVQRLAGLYLWLALGLLASQRAVSGLVLDNILSLLSVNKLQRMGSLLDTSNDEAHKLSAHQLIQRAGFRYENYNALADDGYVTQLIRLINPLADASHMHKTPIIVQHGQTANSKNFIMQSNKQHRPMRWPANASGFGADTWIDRFRGPSANRSLAFMLANNGYDVWLTSSRGVDRNNRGYLGSQPMRTIGRGQFEHKNMTEAESQLLLTRLRRNYWSFSLDDQIAQELPAQIAVVLNVTGADKVSLVGYSNTVLTTLAMLSIRHDISQFVDTFVAIAPVVYYNRLSGWFEWFMNGFIQFVPKNMDAELFLTDELARFLRAISIYVCRPLPVRYTICKFGLNLLFGESEQFTTNLELPFFSHMLRPTSWKCLAQHLQIVRSHRLEKFNYGPAHNRYYYGHMKPPEYDIGQINPEVKIALVSGERDCWANQATVDELRGRLPRNPDLDLVVRGYNHLDLAAAFDNDLKVNLPLLQWLNSHQEPPPTPPVSSNSTSSVGDNLIASGARALDLAEEEEAGQEAEVADNSVESRAEQ